MTSLLEAASPTARTILQSHLAQQLRLLFRRVEKFQDRNFPGQPLDAKFIHLGHEVEELRQAPGDLSEWADVLILYLGAAATQKITLEELLTAAHAKMDENNLRRWSKPDASGVCHHIEDSQS